MSAECKLTFDTVANRSLKGLEHLIVFSFSVCSVSVYVQFQCVLKTSRDCFKFFTQKRKHEYPSLQCLTEYDLEKLPPVLFISQQFLLAALDRLAKTVKNTVELGTSIESYYDDGGLCGLGEEKYEDDEVQIECT